MLRILTILMIAAIASGCASLTTGQNQTVSVQTPDCPEASCELTNKEGSFYISSTPGTVMVNRACAKLTVTCSKDGYTDEAVTVSSSVKAMTFGNILFGGIIGAGVDAATGAACEYPTVIPVPMVCGDRNVTPVMASSEYPDPLRKAADKLECIDVRYIGDGPEESSVYSANCRGAGALLTCNTKDCQFSEYSTVSTE